MTKRDNNEKILLRIYVLTLCVFIFFVVISSKMIMIQFKTKDEYRNISQRNMLKNFVIKPKRGNLFASDGSLLSTTLTRYTIRFDSKTVSDRLFNRQLKPLADSLSMMFKKPRSYFINKLKEAKKTKNRYFLIAKNLKYSKYNRIKQFPIFRKGPYEGGLIVEQKLVRVYPFGEMGKRTIGYGKSEKGNNGVGLERAYEKHLKGINGRRLKQRISKGKWKPINDNNEIEPKDGYDVITTLDINLQDINHKALLKQLQKYDADHGCSVIMETATGEIKAISNLGKGKRGSYYEKWNYAVGESQEPGSTFKTMSLIAALEQKVVDTSYVVDIQKGTMKYYDRIIRDTNKEGYGKINLSRVIGVSSNVGMAKMILDKYKKTPQKLVDKLIEMRLNEKTGLPILGEAMPIIPTPKNNSWSGITLPWMSFGYGVSLTPIQILTFYNAIANKGIRVSPKFLKKVKNNKEDETYINKKVSERIFSINTANKVTRVLKNVIRHSQSTGNAIYTPKIELAGKTGTSQKYYSTKMGKELQYISSFVGFFPVDKPKYTCIVVINEPDKKKGYYGIDVSGPVFKEIATNIYFESEKTYKVIPRPLTIKKVKKEYDLYYENVQKYRTIIPNVVGMHTMDAVPLLENMGLKVMANDIGKVKNQSIKPGARTKKKKIVLQVL